MRTFAQKQNQPQKPVSSSLGQSNIVKHRPDHREHPILHLHRAIANQAGQRMLQTHAEEPEARSTAAASPRFGHDFSRIPVHPPSARAIQTKLAINTPGDEYEQEADRVVEQVMRMPEPQLRHACACGGGCPSCQNAQAVHEHLQTKRVHAGDSGASVAPSIVHEALAAPGQPLDGATRAFMEPRFGHDFSQVRMHTDVRAAESTRMVNARAYTVGQHVVFDAGKYAPETSEGRKLLAHELIHVLQQRSNGEIGFTSGAGMLQRDVYFPRGSMPPYPGVDPEDPFNCEMLIRIEGVTRCDADGYYLVRLDYPICINGLCPGHPDFDPRQHPDYRPEGDEAEILVKYACFAGINCTGRRYRQKYTHCHNCRRGASGRSLLKPGGCENC
jgi:hypothetical protein